MQNEIFFKENIKTFNPCGTRFFWLRLFYCI